MLPASCGYTGPTMSYSAATVSSCSISARATMSVSGTCSGPELLAGAKSAGSIGAARSRFVPLLSWKNPCRPASTQVGCVGRSSAIGKAAASLGAATFASLVASYHPPVLEGGRCDTEGSDFLALVFIAEELG